MGVEGTDLNLRGPAGLRGGRDTERAFRLLYWVGNQAGPQAPARHPEGHGDVRHPSLGDGTAPYLSHWPVRQ
jgi:hypothetical protein